ncbi:hypothetical protein Tco_0726604, partial [Tanacetum coccineum]
SSSRSYRRFYTKEEILAMTHRKCTIFLKTYSFNVKDKDKKCEVYGFIDDELPSEYYKEFFYKLHMENKELKSKLKNLSSQECAHNNYVPNKPSEEVPKEVPMEIILKELITLKVKGKLYDSFMFIVGFGLIMVLVLCLLMLSRN